MTLQDEIIQYRARERITQQEFADRCGLSKQYVHLIESGKINPSKIAKAKIEIVVNNNKEE